MSIFRKIELTFIALLIAAVAGLTLYSLHQKNRADSKQEDVQLQTGRAEAAQTYSDGYKAVTEQRAATNERVQEAIKANPEYSEQPVPADVADLLRHPSGSARAVP